VQCRAAVPRASIRCGCAHEAPHFGANASLPTVRDAMPWCTRPAPAHAQVMVRNMLVGTTTVRRTGRNRSNRYEREKQ